MSVPLRMTESEKRVLSGVFGLDYVVYIAEDVSVVVPGTMDSAFKRKGDAEKEAARLSEMYEHVAWHSYRVQDISS